jgi:F0F1-type ATP synthase assembly protein I
MTEMTREEPRKTKTSPTTTQAAILLLTTIADTTWRAFVPTIGGTFLGIWLDLLFNTVPLLTVIMIIAGFATSALLIALQIRRVRRQR